MFGVMVLGTVVLNLAGVMSIMGGAMSDAPREGEQSAREGAIMVVVSIVLGVTTGVLRYKGVI